MSTAMRGKVLMAFVAAILSSVTGLVGCVGGNQDPFATLSEKLGRPMNEVEFVLYMDSLFVPGSDYREVHKAIDEIGENQICGEIVHLDGVRVEIVEIRTGHVALDEYDYINWDFVFDAEGKLTTVGLNSWWSSCE